MVISALVIIATTIFHGPNFTYSCGHKSQIFTTGWIQFKVLTTYIANEYLFP